METALEAEFIEFIQLRHDFYESKVWGLKQQARKKLLHA